MLLHLRGSSEQNDDSWPPRIYILLGDRQRVRNNKRVIKGIVLCGENSRAREKRRGYVGCLREGGVDQDLFEQGLAGGKQVS